LCSATTESTSRNSLIASLSMLISTRRLPTKNYLAMNQNSIAITSNNLAAFIPVKLRGIAFTASIVALAALTACGGGGGGGSASAGGAAASNTLGGTAAIGLPIVGAMVKVSCAAGASLSSGATSNQGAWQVTLADQKFPCAVELLGGSINGATNTTSYHSIATAPGTINITPLTDMLVANMAGSATPSTWFASVGVTPALLAGVSQAQVDVALSKMRAAFPLLTALASANPLTAKFNPITGDSTDDTLEALKSAIASTGVTHSMLLANAAASGFTVPSEAFGTALGWAFKSTATGGNTYKTSDIVTTAPPAPAYVQGGEELIAFNLLNAERNRCGFGTVTQTALIDQAASAHAAWQVTNMVASHYENSATTPIGFTGYDAAARIAFQGYTDVGGAADIFMALPGGSSKAGIGSLWTRRLLASPFHLRGLVDGMREVGISAKNNTDTGTNNFALFLQFDLAYKGAAGKQQQDSSAVLTYPCQGTADVVYQLVNETPNPVPGRNLAVLPLGHPVLIKVRDGNVLAITSATMTNTATSASVVLRSAAQTRSDDTGALYSQSEAYVIPDAPLSPSTSYSVTVTGTNSGVPFTRNFTFATGTSG
jgi:hypothetical protein